MHSGCILDVQDEEQIRLAVQQAASVQQQLEQAAAGSANSRSESEAQLQELQQQMLVLRQQVQLHQSAAEQESSNAR